MMSDSVRAEGGTGEATDGLGGLSVPIGVHQDAIRACDQALYSERTRRLESEIAHQREMAVANRAADQLAIDKALEAAREIAEKHNDLIRAGEKKDETYALRTDVGRVERWQARLTGGMLLLGAIGLGNLVKLWLA